jgi:molecular chaperone DnaJ
MSKRDYYEVLGVGKSAGADDMKSAFRRLARQYHPDVSKEEDAEERFKEINEAYAVLSDENQRATYDRFGHAGLNGAGRGAPDFGNIDLSDLFGEMFGFGGGSRGSRQNQPRKGRNLQQTIDLTFEESVFGVEKEIKITRDEVCERCDGEKSEPDHPPETCPTCNGQGEVRQARQTLFGSMMQVSTCPACRGEGKIIQKPCRQCRGSGHERKNRTKKVDIPGGVDNGTQIRLSNEGQPGTFNGPAGDLFILLKVNKHEFFQRKDYNIILNLDINIAQAALGADVTIPTVDGDTTLKIPKGIQPGKVLTLKNKGIPHLRSERRGDQLIIINVVTPTKLSNQQEELMEQLAESLGSEVKPQTKNIADSFRDFFGG